MSRLTLIFFLFLSATFLAAQQPPSEETKTRVATLTTTFQSALDRELASTSSPALANLNAKYLAAVERGFTAASKAGNLEEALLWRAEKTRVENQQALPPADADALPPALAALRKTYREAAANFTKDYTAAAALFDQLDADLDALQVELTKNLALDDALSVKAERARFAKLRAETIPADATIKTKPTVPGKAPTLPQWLEQAAKSGGSLRLWGIINKQAIDERAALKDFSASDYVQVATAHDAFILAVRRRGNGQRTLLNKEAQGNHAVGEFRELQSLDRQHGTWLSDDNVYKSNCHQIGNDLDFWESPIVRGGGDGHLLRLDSGEWRTAGFHWTNGETIKPALEPIRTFLQQDNATVLSCHLNRISWITKDKRLREFAVSIRPGSIKEIPVPTRPSEEIVELLIGNGKTFGSWIALGKSGAVYAQATGGFSKPVPELTPAIALRCAGGENLNTIAARRPDGTWHAVGPSKEINRIVAEAGTALDLDLHIGSKTKTVLWIEAKSSIKPK